MRGMRTRGARTRGALGVRTRGALGVRRRGACGFRPVRRVCGFSRTGGPWWVRIRGLAVLDGR